MAATKSPTCAGTISRCAASMPRWPACPTRRSRRSAAAIRSTTPRRCSALLLGAPGPYRDAVLFNAAGALMVAGEVEDWREGVEEAAEVDRQGAGQRLARLLDSRREMTDKLAEICATKRVEVQARKALATLEDLDRAARRRRRLRAGFAARSRQRRPTGFGLIAEIKKASPSKGLIRSDFRPAEHAARLRARRRRLPLGPDRRALFPGARGLPGRRARRLHPAGAAQGFHGRSVASRRKPRDRRRRDPDHRRRAR